MAFCLILCRIIRIAFGSVMMTKARTNEDSFCQQDNRWRNASSWSLLGVVVELVCRSHVEELVSPNDSDHFVSFKNVHLHMSDLKKVQYSMRGGPTKVGLLPSLRFRKVRLFDTSRRDHRLCSIDCRPKEGTVDREVSRVGSVGALGFTLKDFNLKSCELVPAPNGEFVLLRNVEIVRIDPNCNGSECRSVFIHIRCIEPCAVGLSSATERVSIFLQHSESIVCRFRSASICLAFVMCSEEKRDWIRGCGRSTS